MDSRFSLLHNPPTNWMLRLRRGNVVYLVKENEIATIYKEYPTFSFPMYVPTHYDDYQQIGLRRTRGNELWYVSREGTGFDGKPLLYPIDGQIDPTGPPVLDSLQEARDMVEYWTKRRDVLLMEKALGK